jgi:hypothetical protein
MVDKWNRRFLKKRFNSQEKPDCSKLKSYEQPVKMAAVDKLDHSGMQPFFYFRYGRFHPRHRGSQFYKRIK